MKTIEHPEQFKEGVRILMRVLRNKDGGVGNVDRHSKKLVSRNPEEFDKNMARLMDGMLPNERIYSTVDARDISKAVRMFKTEQLNNDYNRPDIFEDFYIDIYNRWISALQQPSARATSLFLWDCDTVEDFKQLREELESLGMEDDERLHMYHYQTKSGGHIITASFAYPKMLDQKWYQLLKKNAMMLWAY